MSGIDSATPRHQSPKASLRYVLFGALSGVLIAASCSASDDGGKKTVGAGGSSASGGSGGSVSTGGVGGSATGGSGGSFNIDASTSDGDPMVDPDAACSTVRSEAKGAQVDIVWVIDNSCSMGDEIAKVEANINTGFVPIIAASPIDWKVFMVTDKNKSNNGVQVAPPLGGPNGNDNPPRYYAIDCHVESNDALLKIQNSYAGTGGFPYPCNRAWRNLARYDSTKVFVVVTDDEALNLLGLGWNAATFDDWAINKVQPTGMFGSAAGRKYVLHGIIGMDVNNPNQACDTTGQPNGNSAVAPGLEYQTLAQLTGGITRSICENDWSDIFNALATGIVQKLACAYVVPQPQDGGAIDKNKVNVTFTNGMGMEEDILYDPGCAVGDGWDWDQSGTQVIMCPNTCQKVQADAMGKIDILVGCATKIIPPPQ